MAAPFGRGDVVVATLRDAAVDPTGRFATAHAHGARVIELDAGHSPFFTQPDELADVLELARLSSTTPLTATCSTLSAARRNSAS